jgi:hypothetical protein
MSRPELEVADIIRRHGGYFLENHQIGPEQRKALRALSICRTSELGGHVDQCDRCGHGRVSYNSCRNRHCPKCQSLARANWIDAQSARVLPVPYYHVVFTIPSSLTTIALQNPAALYAILFRAASQTLIKIAADPKHLGARIGILMVLHTWAQNLMHHPHVHCVVTGGGLSLDGERWVSCRPGFFLPVRVLSRMFRGAFLDLLGQAYRDGMLHFHGNLAPLARPDRFVRALRKSRRHEWVVYAKSPFGGPQQVLAYLGRYTHRVAISNNRLLRLEDGKVTFSYRDRKANIKRPMTLEADEFIRRFLLHILPARFVKIRHYGLLANRHARQNLDLCRSLLVSSSTKEPDTQADTSQNLCDDGGCQDQSESPNELVPQWQRRYEQLTSVKLSRCPVCGEGRMVLRELLPPDRAPSANGAPAPDSS